MKNHDVNDQQLTIGVDLGATKIEIALVDGEGRIIRRTRQPTEAKHGPAHIVGELASSVAAMIPSDDANVVIGLGVGVAGQVDTEAGIVRAAPNLEWREFPLRQHLEAAVKLPVVVMNDVQAATYGEWLHGVARNAEDLVCLFVGTGIGGGIVAAGRLLQGSTGNAGELGHTTIDRNGPKCSCGNHGCLEAFASGWAIARFAGQRMSWRGNEAMTAGDVSEAYRRGDDTARQVVDEIGRALGVGLANIANSFNPTLIVLGGGVIDGLPEVLPIAEAEARIRALAAATRKLRIVRAGLGADAGAIGAARRARDRILGDATPG